MSADLIATETQTCEVCPTQYEGTLIDGRVFYFRYRFGTVALGIGDTDEAAVRSARENVRKVGGRLDGDMSHEAYREWFGIPYPRAAA